ncbi:MAG: VOC family protein [Hydrogenophaga sp.]|uniref:VOC family protein n=1 Tax=Hydrogenophaga sp. TaxID=1904254 RepID=UPI002ABAC007|nr:VOC family protein [Hydrogenophaga sp.]MDZ4101030.1 VOC family protein [Hydrogenophaga sp.]
MTPRIDHLVVAARTLDEGVAWCEDTLGVTPGPGGEHLLFGTHNRLLKLDDGSDRPPYLEIIAINPQAEPTRGAGLKRWFDLDDVALQARLAKDGPQLVHWVASVPDIDAALAALQGIGIQRGPVVSASRDTPHGLLQWRISVRDDGQRLFNGVLPTLIQWGAMHPTQHMPASGITLHQLRLRHTGAAGLRAALQALGLAGMSVVDGHEGPASLVASLDTPAHGRLTLLSPP